MHAGDCFTPCRSQDLVFKLRDAFASARASTFRSAHSSPMRARVTLSSISGIEDRSPKPPRSPVANTSPSNLAMQRLAEQLRRVESPPAPTRRAVSARAVAPAWEHQRSKNAKRRPDGDQSTLDTVGAAYSVRRDEMRRREQRNWEQQARWASPEQSRERTTMGARMGRLARQGNQFDVRQQLRPGICACQAALMVLLVGVLVRL